MARINYRRLWKRVRQIWIALGVGVTVVFVGWSLIAYRALPEARDSMTSDAAVAVTHDRGIWQIARRAEAPARRTALVFFPGALVDPRAYGPLVRAAAVQGFPAFIVELPRRGAFGGADAPELQTRFQAVLRGLDDSVRVVIAGHSRGAVVASQIASRGFPNFAGLVLIGTSHPRDVDLKALSVPTLKISGTRDGLATEREVRQNAGRLPASTRWVWVEGGNHSQFGWYGFQPGDWLATIDASTQRQQTIAAILSTLNEIDAGQRPSTIMSGYH